MTRRALLAAAAAWAGERPRYRKLKSAVVLPAPEESWRPAAFRARCAERLLNGILLRVPAGLKAYCLHCPHEICPVNFVEETRDVRIEEGPKPEHPLLVCPCHFSVFDPAADGARLAGPAHRGLYRFGLKAREKQVEIFEVEEEAL